MEWNGVEWSGYPPSIFTYGPPTEVGAPTGACFESYGRGAGFDFNPTRRDADVKCINRNRAGERERLSRIDITKLLPGSIMRRGIDISSIDFFYNLQLVFVPSFLSAYIQMFERFCYSNTIFGKSLDIPFLNHSIFPDTSLHPRITHDLFPSFFIGLNSDVLGFLFGHMIAQPYDNGTLPSPSILTLCSFASLITPLSPVHSYGGCRPLPYTYIG